MLYLAGFGIGIAAIVGGGTVAIIVVGWVPALAGLGCCIFLVLLNRLIGVWASAAEELMSVESDTRTTLMTQVVESIEAVKLFGWELPFCARLDAIRQDECALVRKSRLLNITIVVLGRAAPLLGALTAVLTYYYIGGDMNAADIFATVTVFQSMRLLVNMHTGSATSICARGR